ncbi:LysR family transcriptional regulator [Vibrio nitrifigilis]|uniref:LysR family transcriptional regulator n=1 Tax=Vibrio nitrifigilis TaxID=2789781 RepID=A0ABS0GKA8_9VIBR|nr:LysR family transcriptional regulator [Vibrio nitrifigilis]MBF9002909.1 LysR family transcriptional regulator [Vibrio nitrifigilis]
MFNNFPSIPIFVAVVECGSFSRAAEKLNLTKSAVSKRINHLEDELGIRLIQRTTRHISLTEAGERYYEHVSKALNFAQQGVDAVAELQGEPKGKLRITAPMSFGVRHVAPFITEFLAQYPHIELDLQLEDRMVDMVAEGYDLAIRIGHLADSNLIAKRLTDCHSVLCASPEYLKNHKVPEQPSDLMAHNCIKYTYFRGGNDWTFLREQQEFKVLPKGNMTVNNSEAIRRTLLSGLGIGQLPTFIVGKDIQAEKLVSIMNHYDLPKHAVYAVYPQRKHLPQKVRLFVDFIAKQYGTPSPYWDNGVF